MAADLDMIKAAAVAIFAMVNAVVYVATDVSVNFHFKKPPFCFVFIFDRKTFFIQRSSISKKSIIKILQN